MRYLLSIILLVAAIITVGCVDQKSVNPTNKFVEAYNNRNITEIKNLYVPYQILNLNDVTDLFGSSYPYNEEAYFRFKKQGGFTGCDIGKTIDPKPQNVDAMCYSNLQIVIPSTGRIIDVSLCFEMDLINDQWKINQTLSWISS